MPQPGGRGHYFVYIGTQAILFGRAAYDTLQNQMKEILKETIVLDDGSDIPKYSCPDWKGNDPFDAHRRGCHTRARDDGHKNSGALRESHRDTLLSLFPARPRVFFAPGPTYRPSTRRNGPDPEAPFAPKSCSSLEIESGASKIARRRGAGSKAAGAPGGPSRRTRPSKSGAAHRIGFPVHWSP